MTTFFDRQHPDNGPPRAAILYGIPVLVALFLAQVIVYSGSFAVLPASDDFPIVNEIHRGSEHGIKVFFTDSVTTIGYRPLKSLSIWLCGKISPTHPMVAVRIMNLLAALAYGIVALLWLRKMNLGWIGMITAFSIILLHPVMTAAVGSCDSIDTLASSTLLWFGAWCITSCSTLPIRAALTALACFVVGVGFKENLFALLPISFVVIPMLWPWARKRGLAAVGITLVIACAAAILVRLRVIHGGLSAGSEMVRIDPIQYAKNASLFAAGLLYFGDSLAANLNLTDVSMFIMAMAALTTVAMIFLGIVRQFRRDEFIEAPPVRGWVWFWVIGMCLASFPTIVLYHVSEMYVPPMVLPFAMLCAIAAEGWASMKRPKRILAVAVAGIALVSSVLAVRHKVDGLVDVGVRSKDQIDQILNLLPPDAHELRIGLIYDYDELIRMMRSGQVSPGRQYSVFAMGDEILLVHKGVLDWVRPGKKLTLEVPPFDHPEQLDPASVDVIMHWSFAARKFTRLGAVTENRR